MEDSRAVVVKGESILVWVTVGTLVEMKFTMPLSVDTEVTLGKVTPVELCFTEELEVKTFSESTLYELYLTIILNRYPLRKSTPHEHSYTIVL